MAKSFPPALFLLMAFSVVSPLCLSAKASAQPSNIPWANIIAQNNLTDKARLAEAVKLTEQAIELSQQKKYQEAIPLAQQALAITKEVLGEKHPDTATSLKILGSLYYFQRNYDEAEPLYQQALAIRKEVLGDKHPDTVTVINNLGSLYYFQRNYAKAEPLYQQALAIRKEVLGEKHLLTVESINNLADLYYIQGNYAKAEPLYQQALAIRKKVLGEKHPDTASSLNNLAALYKAQGNYAKAEPLYQQALAIRKKVLGEKHPDTASSLNNLAALYKAQGNYTKAEPLYQQALAIRKEVLGEKHLLTATSLNNLALLYQNQGNYAKAEPLLQQTLDIYKEVLGEKHPLTATSLNNLASLYQDQGNYTEAELLYQQALAIRKEVLGEKHPATADSLNNLGLLYYFMGNYAKAELLYQQALDIRKEVLGNKHPDTAITLTNLATLYQDQGNYTEAELLYQQALAIRKKVLGEKHPNTATTLGNLAALHQDQRDYTKAEPLYQQALAIRKEVLGEKHPDTAITLNNLAWLYYSQEDYQKAEPLYQQALAIRKEVLGEKHSSTANTLNNLAGLYWAENKINLALDNFTQGTEIEEYNLAAFLNEIGDESRKQAYIQTLSGSTSGTIALHLNSALNNPQAARLALTIILRRKGRVLDALSNIVAILRQNATPQTQALFNQLAEKKTQLVALSYSGLSQSGKSSVSNPEVQAETKKLLITSLEQDIQQLETKLSQESVQFRLTTQAITLDGVQQAIPQNTALVEYMVYSPINPKTQEWGKPRYAAYILHPTGEPQGIDLGDAETIDKTIKAFRATLSDPSLSYTEEEIQENGQKLYQQVFKPLLPLLKNTTNLLIAPDSQLNLVPFAAIQDEQGKYLVENYSLNYLTSGRDLLKLKTQFNPKSSAVVVANPTYNLNPSQVGSATQANRGDSQRSADLSKIDWCCQPLSGTKLEAEAITPLLPHVQVYTGEKALAETVRQINAPQVLHLATHGFFLPDIETKTPEKPLLPSGKTPVIEGENPLLRSGLALAGFNPAQHKMDGALTALDVSSLNLWGTKLVVLSACQTGLGDVRNGEGVYGLRRAFVLAGAESQLMSLWSVSDEGTKELMVAYYQRLIKGEGRSEALRQVQLQMLKSEQFSNPFFWAAFIPSGDWRSLDAGK